MTTVYEFTVPGEPVGKGRPRFARVGAAVRTFTDDKTAANEKTIAYCARTILPRFDDDAAIGVDLLFVFARPQRLLRKKDGDGFIAHSVKPDVDNTSKQFLDSVKHHLRDQQVSQLTARKVFAERGGLPRTEARIWRIT